MAGSGGCSQRTRFLHCGYLGLRQQHGRHYIFLRGSRAMSDAVASGLDQAMQAAGTDASAALASGKTLNLEQARDEALELARVTWVRRTSIP